MVISVIYFIWQVSEVKSWLADESVWAHFESLELDVVCLIQMKLKNKK